MNPEALVCWEKGAKGKPGAIAVAIGHDLFHHPDYDPGRLLQLSEMGLGTLALHTKKGEEEPMLVFAGDLGGHVRDAHAAARTVSRFVKELVGVPTMVAQGIPREWRH